MRKTLGLIDNIILLSAVISVSIIAIGTLMIVREQKIENAFHAESIELRKSCVKYKQGRVYMRFNTNNKLTEK